MSISYPLTPPPSPVHSQFEFTMLPNNVLSKNPFNYKATVQEHAGKAWIFSIGFPPMTREQASPWFAFLAKLDGVRGSFLYGSHLWRSPLGLAGGNPKVNGANQTGQSLATDGWTNSSAIFKAGDMIQIDYSLYQVLNDVSANGSGQATLDVWPNLRSHADNATIIISNPKCKMRLRQNGATFTELATRHFALSIEAEEAL